MPNLLILYGSTHGHTGKIAERVAKAARERGADAHVHDVGSGHDPMPADYDAVIVGASIHGGHYQRAISQWVKGYSHELGSMPSALFSSCLTAADDTEESRDASRKYIEDFVYETGWHPRMTATFAGALQYREYDFATRLVMRLLMRHGHHETDTSRDHDYTDWDAVDRFGHDCAAMLTEEAVAK
jgi:menaquinone-dependent protoporphyrinogen oxidase